MADIVDTQPSPPNPHDARLLGRLRVRWAAIGAAIAVTLGAGGFGLVSATVSSGERLTYVSIDPCRLVDLRPAFQVGPRSTPLGPEETFTVTAHGSTGQCTGIPADALAVDLNVTALDATRPTFLSFWPSGGDRPNASALNPTPGQPPTPNAVTTKLSAGGSFDMFNRDGSVNVVIDLVGYFVDHDHDDIYERPSEIEARIEANLAEPDTGPEVIDIGVYELAEPPFLTGFSLNGFEGWEHSGGFAACLVAPLRLIPGQQVESVSFTVAKQSAGTHIAEVSLSGFETRPNDSTGPFQPLHAVLTEVGLLYEGGPGTRVEPVTSQAVPGGDRTVRAGHAYRALFCTSDPVVVFGARVVLSNP